MRNDFAVFILTHGRPEYVYTIDTLKRHGYTGRVYLIIDNEDKTAQKYYDNYGSQVIEFDKADIETRFDTGDNFGDRRTITHARNACYEIAENLGLSFFIQLDDDYTSFQYRFDENLKWQYSAIKNLDDVFSELLSFYENTPIDTIALAQGGDFIGGQEGMGKSIKLKRKSMNSFICSPDRRIKFRGTMNEDVNTYVFLGTQGRLFFTMNYVALNQLRTQSNAGGITELYLDKGTYTKSMYSVMYNPSCVKISEMNTSNRRIHHIIQWDHTAPKILHEKHRKPDA